MTSSTLPMTMLPQLRRLLSLVDWSLRLRLVGLAVLTVLGSVLEVAGVTMVFPLFQVMLDRERLVRQSWFQDWFGGVPIESLLLAVCGLILVIFIAKSGVALLTSWLKLRIQALLFQTFSGALFRHYLARPVAFHADSRVSELIRNMTSYAGQVTQFGVLGLADLASDLIVCAGIFAVLAFVQPAISLAALVAVSLAAFIYIRIGQPHFIRWGRAYNAASAMLTQTSMEALAGIKTIKVAGCERYFEDEYRKHAASYSDIAARNNFASAIPRQVLELVAVVAIVGTIMWAVLAGENLATLISVLALFAAAIYRMMPSVVRIATTLQNLRVSQEAITVLCGELVRQSPPVLPVGADRPRPLTREIAIRNLGFQYPGSGRPTLRDINLTIRRGDIVAFAGRSGAGKTTLADVILGLQPATAGTVTVDGVVQDAGDAIRGLFGYVPQEPFLMDDTIRRNIALGTPDHLIDSARIEAAVRTAALDGFVSAQPAGLDTMVGDRGVRISGGQRQRLGIARAIYADRDVLVLDEATSAVDMNTEAEISSAINRLRGSKTLIVIAHRLSTVRHCDRIFFMSEGQVVASGTFDELLDKNEEFAAMVRLMSVEAEASVLADPVS